MILRVVVRPSLSRAGPSNTDLQVTQVCHSETSLIDTTSTPLQSWSSLISVRGPEVWLLTDEVQNMSSPSAHTTSILRSCRASCQFDCKAYSRSHCLLLGLLPRGHLVVPERRIHSSTQSSSHAHVLPQYFFSLTVLSCRIEEGWQSSANRLSCNSLAFLKTRTGVPVTVAPGSEMISSAPASLYLARALLLLCTKRIHGIPHSFVLVLSHQSNSPQTYLLPTSTRDQAL